jgi:hypothetical protein
MVWTGLIWLRYRPVDNSCEHGDEPSGSIKYWVILEYLSDWRLLKKGSAARSWLVVECKLTEWLLQEM